MKIIFGLIGIALAFLLIKFRYQIQEIFGTFGWAERYFGSTEFAIVAIAVITFFASLMYMTGTLDGFLNGTLNRIF